MATYYKNKNQVKLKAGQTLGYTAGKGYYAAGSPTSHESSGTPAKASSEAVPTATRPKAAETPTAPPEARGRSHRKAPPVTDADSLSSGRAWPPAASSMAQARLTDHYTKPWEVPLRPGQTLAFTSGEGYYAEGRPNPTKASTKPRSSTEKIVALPMRGSTESPIKEHVETRDGKTTIRLFHATKPGSDATRHEKRVSARASQRSSKPHAAASVAHKSRKASLRVDDELARARQRAGHAAAGKAAPQPHKASRARVFTFHPDTLFEALVLSHLKLEEHADFDVGGFRIDVSVEGNVQGPQLTLRDGRLELVWGDNVLASVKLDGVLYGLGQLARVADSTDQKLKDLLSGTVKLPGGESVSTTLHPGISVTVTAGDATTTVGLIPPDTFFVTTSVTGHLALRPPLKPVDVDLTSTVKITPNEKKKAATKADTKKTIEERAAPAYQTRKGGQGFRANPTGILRLPTGPRVGGGEHGDPGASDAGGGLGGGATIDNPSALLAAYVSHGGPRRSAGDVT